MDFPTQEKARAIGEMSWLPRIARTVASTVRRGSPRLVWTTIEFDDVPGGAVIDSHYANRGVVFRSVTTNPPANWSAYAAQFGGAKTAPNTVALSQESFFNTVNGGIEAEFTTLQSGVSVFAQPTHLPEQIGQLDDNRPFLEAYDENHVWLETVRFPLDWSNPDFGTWQTITVGRTPAEWAAHPNIKFVRFSCETSNFEFWAAFDSLSFWHYER